MAKKTEPKKRNKITDYFDIVSQIVAGYFSQKLKITKKVEDIKNVIFDALYNFKAQIFKSAIEIFLLITGLAALIIGIFMFLSRYLSLDILLIAYGVIISLIVLAAAKLKR